MTRLLAIFLLIPLGAIADSYYGSGFPAVGDLSMGSHKLTNLAACTTSTDAANKAYVDATTTLTQVYYPTQSATFNGTTAYVSTASSVSLGDADWAVSWRMKVTDFAGYRAVFSSYTTGANKGFQVYTNVTTGKLNISLYGANDTSALAFPASSGDYPTLGSWEHHFVAYHNGAFVYIKNGVPITLTQSNNLNVNPFNNVPLTIGADEGGTTSFFKGQIADVAIWVGDTVGQFGIDGAADQAYWIYNNGKPNYLLLGQLHVSPTVWYQFNGDVTDSMAFANGTAHNITYAVDLPTVEPYTYTSAAQLKINGSGYTPTTPIQIGTAFSSPAHYYPIVSNSAVPARLGSSQWWNINSSTAAIPNNYSAIFVGQDRDTHFGSINYLNPENTGGKADVMQVESNGAQGLNLLTDGASQPINLMTNGTAAFQIDGNQVLVNKQAANESTGSTATSWGSNCPASTCTSPFTWLKMKTSDGSVVYMPLFK